MLSPDRHEGSSIGRGPTLGVTLLRFIVYADVDLDLTAFGLMANLGHVSGDFNFVRDWWVSLHDEIQCLNFGCTRGWRTVIAAALAGIPFNTGVIA